MMLILSRFFNLNRMNRMILQITFGFPESSVREFILEDSPSFFKQGEAFQNSWKTLEMM